MKKTIYNARQHLVVFFILCFSFGATAQGPIPLPHYTQGQYEVDTIYTYYGALLFSGYGTIDFNNFDGVNWVDGLEFKLVVDTVDFPGAVVYDSSGTSVAMKAGDTLPIPIAMTAFNGNVGFHVIIEGTPLSAGQSYLCDLGIVFTLGNDFGMYIMTNSTDTCVVDNFQPIEKVTSIPDIRIFPNPASNYLNINSQQSAIQSLHIMDLNGRLLKSIDQPESNINIQGLAKGIYFIQIKTNQGIQQLPFAKY